MPNKTEKLVDFLVGATFDDLPRDVVHETKRALLDSAGCAIAGLQMQASKITVEFAGKLGGPEESSILGTRKKVARTNAAFANGQLINAQDFDAGAAGAGTASHDTASIVAGALAQAEAGGASGKDLVLAIALGHEVSMRLRAAEGRDMTVAKDGQSDAKLSHARVFGFSGVTLAVAASVGKLLDLDRERMTNALGIASFICPPNTVMRYFDMSPVKMTKYTVFGQIAQVGVQAAMLAEMGFTGDDDILEGQSGFFEFTGGAPIDADVVTEGIGEKWVHSVDYKRYPSNYPTAGAKDCFIQIIEENNLRPDEIEKITARIWPIWHRRSMRGNTLSTEEEYLFNVVYQLACAAHRIEPTRWHLPEVKNDGKIADFMRRVDFDIGCDEQAFTHAKLADPNANLSAAEVTARGETFRKETLYRKGLHEPAEFRMTDEEITKKFKENVSDMLKEDAATNASNTILDAENIDDVTKITDMLIYTAT